VTNKKRVQVNAIQNARDKPAHATHCSYEGEDPKQQEMWVWPGLEVQAAKTERKHGLKNAVIHKVLQIDEDTCQLARGKETFTVPTAEMTQLFRPTHALTIDSSQSRTITGQLLITELDHPHFNLRRLVVALGRSPLACNVQGQ